MALTAACDMTIFASVLDELTDEESPPVDFTAFSSVILGKLLGYVRRFILTRKLDKELGNILLSGGIALISRGCNNEKYAVQRPVFVHCIQRCWRAYNRRITLQRLVVSIQKCFRKYLNRIRVIYGYMMRNNYKGVAVGEDFLPFAGRLMEAVTSRHHGVSTKGYHIFDRNYGMNNKTVENNILLPYSVWSSAEMPNIRYHKIREKKDSDSDLEKNIYKYSDTNAPSHTTKRNENHNNMGEEVGYSETARNLPKITIQRHNTEFLYEKALESENNNIDKTDYVASKWTNITDDNDVYNDEVDSDTRNKNNANNINNTNNISFEGMSSHSTLLQQKYSPTTANERAHYLEIKNIPQNNNNRCSALGMSKFLSCATDEERRKYILLKRRGVEFVPKEIKGKKRKNSPFYLEMKKFFLFSGDLLMVARLIFKLQTLRYYGSYVRYYYDIEIEKKSGAVLIQSSFRGYYLRKKVKKFYFLQLLSRRSVICIQRYWRYCNGLKRRFSLLSIITKKCREITSQYLYIDIWVFYLLIRTKKMSKIPINFITYFPEFRGIPVININGKVQFKCFDCDYRNKDNIKNKGMVLKNIRTDENDFSNVNEDILNRKNYFNTNFNIRYGLPSWADWAPEPWGTNIFAEIYIENNKNSDVKKKKCAKEEHNKPVYSRGDADWTYFNLLTEGVTVTLENTNYCTEQIKYHNDIKSKSHDINKNPKRNRTGTMNNDINDMKSMSDEIRTVEEIRVVKLNFGTITEAKSRCALLMLASYDIRTWTTIEMMAEKEFKGRNVRDTLHNFHISANKTETVNGIDANINNSKSVGKFYSQEILRSSSPIECKYLLYNIPRCLSVRGDNRNDYIRFEIMCSAIGASDENISLTVKRNNHDYISNNDNYLKENENERVNEQYEDEDFNDYWQSVKHTKQTLKCSENEASQEIEYSRAQSSKTSEVNNLFWGTSHEKEKKQEKYMIPKGDKKYKKNDCFLPYGHIWNTSFPTRFSTVTKALKWCSRIHNGNKGNNEHDGNDASVYFTENNMNFRGVKKSGEISKNNTISRNFNVNLSLNSAVIKEEAAAATCLELFNHNNYCRDVNKINNGIKNEMHNNKNQILNIDDFLREKKSIEKILRNGNTNILSPQSRPLISANYADEIKEERKGEKNDVNPVIISFNERIELGNSEIIKDNELTPKNEKEILGDKLETRQKSELYSTEYFMKKHIQLKLSLEMKLSSEKMLLIEIKNKLLNNNNEKLKMKTENILHSRSEKQKTQNRIAEMKSTAQKVNSMVKKADFILLRNMKNDRKMEIKKRIELIRNNLLINHGVEGSSYSFSTAVGDKIEESASIYSTTRSSDLKSIGLSDLPTLSPLPSLALSDLPALTLTSPSLASDLPYSLEPDFLISPAQSVPCIPNIQPVAELKTGKKIELPFTPKKPYGLARTRNLSLNNSSPLERRISGKTIITGNSDVIVPESEDIWRESGTIVVIDNNNGNNCFEDSRKDEEENQSRGEIVSFDTKKKSKEKQYESKVDNGHRDEEDEDEDEVEEGEYDDDESETSDP